MVKGKRRRKKLEREETNGCKNSIREWREDTK